MLCREYKCIFVHIPKTAGQSIEHFFLRRLGLSWEDRSNVLMRYNDNPKLGPERLAHLTAAEYVGCGHITQAEFAEFFKFTFVRNPWARLVSEYEYRGLPRALSFRDFLLRGLPPPGLSDAYRHIIPQANFIFDRNGGQMVDFVGRFERLQQDFDIVCNRLGIAESTLPHVNASGNTTIRRRKYTEYYDRELADRVAAMYARDIETFGYRFGE